MILWRSALNSSPSGNSACMRRFSACMAAIALMLTSGCGDDALDALREDVEADVGKPCVPPDESDPMFRGYSNQEVGVAGTSECSTGVCLINHFKGRVTCPYGQSPSDLENSCLLPGTSRPVLVPVQPQDANRRADLAVTCSCRCAGPGDGPFCSCPSGTECVHVVDNLGLPGSAEVAGSYCIRPEARWTRTQGPECSSLLLNCGPR